MSHIQKSHDTRAQARQEQHLVSNRAHQQCQPLASVEEEGEVLRRGCEEGVRLEILESQPTIPFTV